MVRGSISGFLLGSDRRLRPLLRALLYAVLAFWALSADEFLGPPLQRAATALHASGLSAGRVTFFAAVNLLTALLLTWVFGRYEGRRVDDYGLPLSRAFGARFGEGFAIGVMNAALVAAAMIACGGMTVHGLAVAGATIVSATLAWLLACLLVGIAEEYLFRGYLLQTLAQSVGFWPATFLIALWFGADHFFFKPGENLGDLVSLVAIAVWLGYSVRKTGTLWLAVGYHAAFDFMQLFVIGTKNGGSTPVDHLLNTSFQGPAWVTGGELGTEASFFIYPSTALLFLYLWRRRCDDGWRSLPK